MPVADLAALIAAALQCKPTAVHLARISGGSAVVGGRLYPFEAAVDEEIVDGDLVYVVINDAGTRAVVVGK